MTAVRQQTISSARYAKTLPVITVLKKGHCSSSFRTDQSNESPDPDRTIRQCSDPGRSEGLACVAASDRWRVMGVEHASLSGHARITAANSRPDSTSHSQSLPVMGVYLPVGRRTLLGPSPRYLVPVPANVQPLGPDCFTTALHEWRDPVG